MNSIRSSLFGVVVLLASVAAACAGEFASVQEAIAVIQDENSKDWKRMQEAEEYLLKSPEDALPALMKMVKNQEEGWITAAYTMAKSKDPQVVPLCIGLVRENLFLKEADGSRMKFGFGSVNGCEVRMNQFGSVLASLLGRIGDLRAIPVLKEAVKQGDPEVQRSAYEALYELGVLSIDEIFEIAKTAPPSVRMPDLVVGIIHALNNRDPERAVELYDRVITDFPEESYEVASAHYWKIQCYRNLKKFERALEQCDVVLRVVKFENLTEQMAGMRTEISKAAQQDGAGQPAAQSRQIKQ